MNNPAPAAKIVEHKRYINTDVAFGEKGHNKFWYYTKYADNSVKVEWGRVDLTQAEKIYTFGSSEEADKFIAGKVKDKLKGKKGDSAYEELNVVAGTSGQGSSSKLSGAALEAEAIQQIAKGDPKVSTLVKYLVKQNIHNITSNTNIRYDEATGCFSTPLGIVGQSNIDDARVVLADMAVYVKKNDLENAKIAALLSKYMRLIPQGVGMNRPSLHIICPDEEAVVKQSGILDSLQASLDFITKMPSGGKTEEKAKVWDISLALITDKGELDRIARKFQATMHRNHACAHLKVRNAYTVQISHMDKAYSADGEKVGGVMELWHGTRAGNILSIFAKGLIIPPSNAGFCTGRMFGNGVYFSDQSTKSLNYSYGYWDGKGADNNCFMFLADVAMGKYHTPRSTCSKPESGCDSVFAKAGASGVANNEMIVYRTSQCRVKRLIEFGS